MEGDNSTIFSNISRVVCGLKFIGCFLYINLFLRPLYNKLTDVTFSKLLTKF